MKTERILGTVPSHTVVSTSLQYNTVTRIQNTFDAGRIDNLFSMQINFLSIRPKHASRIKASRCFSAIDTLFENQINAWIRNGGDKDLQNKGQPLTRDRHRHFANALGIGNEYIHSKILAANNIKPESIQRRLDMDKKWKELQGQIQQAYQKYSSNAPEEEFATSKLAQELFDAPIQELDRQAKRVNDAIISDSMLFNGRSPVPHARPFRLRERILEALLRK